MTDDSDLHSRRFLTAQWRHLLMLNFEIDPEVLQPLVPAGTTLDNWQGKTFVSLVGFRFLRTRVLRLPIPLHCNFDEVNLRFYVRRETAGQTRRGVVFVKEIVPRSAIAWVARTIYNENYVAMPMRHQLLPSGDGAERLKSVRYEWKHQGRWNHMQASIAGEPELPTTDSQENFITEHYWGYAAQRDASTMEYHVDHPRWRVWQVSEAHIDCDVESIYGRQFSEPLSSVPASTFIADGSQIAVYRGSRISEDSPDCTGKNAGFA